MGCILIGLEAAVKGSLNGYVQTRIVARIEALFSEIDKGVENLSTVREQLKVYRQAVFTHAFQGKLTADWREKNKFDLESPKGILERIREGRDARNQEQVTNWNVAINEWEASGKNGRKPVKPKKLRPVISNSTSLLDIPLEWTWACLDALNADIFDGPFGSNLKSSDYISDGVRVIRLENIGDLRFIEAKKSYVSVDKYESIKGHTVYHGDIIVSSFITDGIRVTVLPETIGYAINKADCFCLRLHGGSVRNDYVATFLATRIAYKQIEANIHGVGRPRINTSQVRAFSIPLCSREEQDRIMDSLSATLSLIDGVHASIEAEMVRAESLRQSILKKAFSGRLVPQDPDDEPASILLKRIKAEKAAAATSGKRAGGRKTA